MRHGMANKKLNRTSEHRKALLKNMLNSLIKYEQIIHNECPIDVIYENQIYNSIIFLYNLLPLPL